MSIITLTTDLGYRDPYLAIVKAKLLSSKVQTQILDLSCDIKDSNITHAAFIVKNALPFFPSGTIHLVAVKFIADRSGLQKGHGVDNSRFLLCKYHDQIIICPDNGFLTLLDENFNSPVYQIYYEGQNKQHFFLKDVFVDTALQLLSGQAIEDLSSITTDYYKAFQFQSYLNGNLLRGKGIYVDDFGNIICNLTREKFYEVVGTKGFTITLPGARITKILNTYEDVKYGSPLVFFNSFGYLEVAVNGKSAFNMLCPRDIGNNFDFNLLIEIHD